MAEAGHLAEQGALLCFPTYHMFGSSGYILQITVQCFSHTTAGHDRRTRPSNLQPGRSNHGAADEVGWLGGWLGGFGKTDY